MIGATTRNATVHRVSALICKVLELRPLLTARARGVVCRRGVAQPGSAPQWGCGGREFESRRPDQSDFSFRLRLPLGRSSRAALLGCALVASLVACGDLSDPRAAFDAGHFSKSLKLAEAAAGAGDAQAMNLLGVQYYLGAGVPRDFAVARRWFESAALKNDLNAQCNIAMLYLRGLGGAQDFMRAYAWFERADQGGNPRAKAYLAVMGDSLTPNQITKGRLWLQQALPR